MKLSRFICLLIAIGTASLALADLPFPNDAFGKLEGTLDSCAQADPPNSQKYEEQKAELVRDVPADEAAKARESKEYKDSYAWVKDQMSKLPKDEVVKTCKASIEQQ